MLFFLYNRVGLLSPILVKDILTYLGILSYEHEDYRHLLKQINMLSEKYQEVLRLRYWSGMKLSEVAEFLGIDEGTAKVRHFRALNELRKKIKE